MNRPWKIWLGFALCSAVLVAVMTWVSATALRLERAQAEAQRQAILEENVRLALWRMDSMLAPLITQESARPYFTFNPFYAAEGAYGRMFNPLAQGEVLVPSPLLVQTSSNVLLHFQFDPERRLTSPEVPDGNQRDLAEAQFTTHEQVEAAAARLKQFEQIMAQPAAPSPARMAGAGSTTAPSNGELLLAIAPAPPASEYVLVAHPGSATNLPSRSRLQPTQRDGLEPSRFARSQIARSAGELQARAQSVQRAFDLNVLNSDASFRPTSRISLTETLMQPLWLGDSLVFARRVVVQGRDYVQGCWLDWPGICRWLLDSVQDLLPDATLEPLRNGTDDPRERMLAALPVRVVPGPTRSDADVFSSPILIALVLAWVGVLGAGVAAAALLRGTLSLSERRAAFVSSVTHELRTPLTTFKMYSEMLADGMVPDPDTQKQYLTTLCSEANRLDLLVENVLTYARLERGSARSRLERVTLGALIGRVKPRLSERARQVGLILQEDGDVSAQATVVQVDVAAVEQILFNLVDNACKYAAPVATEKVIHLEARPVGSGERFAVLRVRDHGQGIPPDAARRLFRPFSKSANEAARATPGVGLGLALCRRLSRSLGGDLRRDVNVKAGACFELRLPVSRP